MPQPRLLVLLLVVAVPCIPLAAQDDAVYLPIPSPGGAYEIVADGTLHASGKVVLRTLSATIPLFEADFRYAPEVTWLSPKVARVWVGTGNAFSVRYVQAEPIRISPEFPLAVAETPDLSMVLTLDYDRVGLFSIWTGQLVQSYQAKGLLPFGFLGPFRGTVLFPDRSHFVLAWTENDGTARDFEFSLP